MTVGGTQQPDYTFHIAGEPTPEALKELETMAEAAAAKSGGMSEEDRKLLLSLAQTYKTLMEGSSGDVALDPPVENALNEWIANMSKPVTVESNPWENVASWVAFTQALGKIQACFADMIRANAALDDALIGSSWDSARALADAAIKMGTVMAQELMKDAQIANMKGITALASCAIACFQAGASAVSLGQGNAAAKTADQDAQAKWLNNPDNANNWLASDKGKDWENNFLIKTDQGKDFLNSDDGKKWLNTQSGNNWLTNTDEGKAWGAIPANQQAVLEISEAPPPPDVKDANFFTKFLQDDVKNGNVTLDGPAGMPFSERLAARQQAWSTRTKTWDDMITALGSAGSQACTAISSMYESGKTAEKATLKTIEQAYQAIRDLAGVGQQNFDKLLQTGEQLSPDLVKAFHEFADVAKSFHVSTQGGAA